MVRRFSRCCCDSTLECSDCDSTPAEFQVVISGMANDNCTDCESLDGTYIVDQRGQEQECIWGTFEEFSASTCLVSGTVPTQDITLVLLSGTTGRVDLDLRSDVGGLFERYIWNFTFTENDCGGIDGVVSSAGAYSLGLFFQCDPSAATVTITAL